MFLSIEQKRKVGSSCGLQHLKENGFLYKKYYIFSTQFRKNRCISKTKTSKVVPFLMDVHIF